MRYLIVSDEIGMRYLIIFDEITMRYLMPGHEIRMGGSVRCAHSEVEAASAGRRAQQAPNFRTRQSSPLEIRHHPPVVLKAGCRVNRQHEQIPWVEARGNSREFAHIDSGHFRSVVLTLQVPAMLSFATPVRPTDSTGFAKQSCGNYCKTTGRDAARRVSCGTPRVQSKGESMRREQRGMPQRCPN